MSLFIDRLTRELHETQLIINRKYGQIARIRHGMIELATTAHEERYTASEERLRDLEETHMRLQQWMDYAEVELERHKNSRQSLLERLDGANRLLILEPEMMDQIDASVAAVEATADRNVAAWQEAVSS